MVTPLQIQASAVSARKTDWAYVGILCCLVFLVYLPSLKNELIFDDGRLTDGTIFGQYGNWLEIKRRMLSYGSFVWLQNLLGEGWWKQRLVNIGIHALFCFVVYRFTLLLFKLAEFNPVQVGIIPMAMSANAGQQGNITWAVRMAVLLFAVSPVAVYAVAYLVQRATLMVSFFVLLACYTYLLGLVAQGSQRYVLWLCALASYVAAVLSKETMAVAGVALVPLYIFAARPGWRRLLGITIVSVVLLLGGVFLLKIYAGSLFSIVGNIFDENSRFFKLQLEAMQPGIGERLYPLSILQQATLFFAYGFFWLVPNVAWMSVDLRPAFPLSFTAMPQLLGAIGYVSAGLLGAWLLLRSGKNKVDDSPPIEDERTLNTSRLVGMCLVLPVLLYVAEFATVWVQDPFVLYRGYQWALMIPCVFALMLLLLPRKVMLIAGSALAILFAVLSIERMHSLENDNTVWSDAIDKIDLTAPANAVGRWRAYINRGNTHLERGNAEKAFADFVKADQLGEPYGSAKFSMGAALQLIKKHPDALKAFAIAEQAGFTEPSLYLQRGESYAAMGRLPEALDAYTAALAKPQAPESERVTRTRRAETAVPLQKYDVAVLDFKQLLKDKPADKRLLVGLGMAYIGQKDADSAIATFDSALAAAPIAHAHYGRALAHDLKGNKTSALKDLDIAIAMAPQQIVYRNQRDKTTAGR